MFASLLHQNKFTKARVAFDPKQPVSAIVLTLVWGVLEQPAVSILSNMCFIERFLLFG